MVTPSLFLDNLDNFLIISYLFCTTEHKDFFYFTFSYSKLNFRYSAEMFCELHSSKVNVSGRAFLHE